MVPPRIASPYRVLSSDELPAHIQQTLEELCPNERLLYVSVMPREQSWLQVILGVSTGCTYFVLTPNRLVFVHDSPGSLRSESRRIESLPYFEVGTILLHSWIRIPFTEESPNQQITLSYNSVFEREFREAILRLRALTSGLGIEADNTFKGMSGEELIQSLPFKFNNVVRRYWLHGEAALATVFIPAIRVPYLRYFSRVYSFATAMIVTDKQVLIVIEQGVEGSAGKYGEAWVFCPLQRIASAFLEDVPKYDIRTFRLEMGPQQHRETINVPYLPEQEHDVLYFLEAIDRAKANSSS